MPCLAPPILRRLAVAIGLALAGVPVALRAQGYQVIVHANNGATTLPREEVSRLFLKKAPEWPWGAPVVVVDLPEKSGTRAAFSKDVHGKSVTAIKTYWQQQVFSGRGVPPVERPGDAEVVAYVRENVNAIGYVSAGAPLGRGVKAVAIVAR